jgi:hypothetical protein
MWEALRLPYGIANDIESNLSFTLKWSPKEAY